MKGWIENCKANHKEGCERKESFVPTRLLDLSGDDETVTRVVQFAPDEKKSIKYAALSHLWSEEDGGHCCTLTNKDNLEEMTERIDIQYLELNFKDAITVCRAMGIQYLWIDSLCILQDDPEDWKREASQINKIYGYAEFTIAA